VLANSRFACRWPAVDGEHSKGNQHIIISAATEKGFAAEHRTWGHGAFTYAMEKGLKGEVDSNNDGSISARELYFYVSREVISLTNKLQHPTGPDPEKIGLGDFTIYLLRGK